MKLLVTGVAGTGKSTLAAKLKKHQLPCIDDATNGTDLGVFFDADEQKLPRNPHQDPDFSWDRYSWGWDIPKLESFLDKNNPAIVCGYTGDIVRLARKYFGQVVLLDTTPEVINKRLSKRPFGYGFKQDERKQALADLPQLRKRLAPLNPVVIDANQPINKVADKVQKLIKS